MNNSMDRSRSLAGFYSHVFRYDSVIAAVICPESLIVRMPQFKLRTLFILTTMSAVFFASFGVWTLKAFRQRDAIAALRSCGANVIYEHWGDCSNLNPVAAKNETMRRLLGDDYFHGLAVVELRGIHVTKSIAETVSQFEQFQYLDLLGSTCDSEAWAVLLKRNDIKKLRINSDAIDSFEFADLRSFPKLEELTVECSTVSRSEIDEISMLANLLELSVYSTATRKCFEPLSALKKLERLTLHCNNCSDNNLSFLSSLSNLKELDIESDSLTDDALQYVASCKNAERLCYDCNLMTVNGFQEIIIDNATNFPNLYTAVLFRWVSNPDGSSTQQRIAEYDGYTKLDR